MDVNYYLHREQIERIRAERATSDEARAAHRRMAELYRARVDAYLGEGEAAPDSLLVATAADEPV